MQPDFEFRELRRRSHGSVFSFSGESFVDFSNKGIKLGVQILSLSSASVWVGRWGHVFAFSNFQVMFGIQKDLKEYFYD